jgi:hypothetical protein
MRFGLDSFFGNGELAQADRIDVGMSALQIDAQNGCSRQASGQPASFEFI